MQSPAGVRTPPPDDGELYRDLFEQAGCAIVLIDPESSRIVDANAEACRCLGYSHEEFRCLTLSDLDVPGTPGEPVPIIAARAPEWVRTRKRTKSGAVRDFEVRAKGVRVGNRVVIQSIWRDVSELSRAQEALRRSEEKYRVLHETMTDAFARVNMRGRIVEFNKAYAQMLGYSPDELRRLTYIRLTPRKWHAMEARIVREQILPHGHSEVYEKEYRRKDGTVFPVELRAFLIRDATGAPDSMWAIVRDVSERHRRTEQLRASEEHYRLMVEAVPIMAWRCAANGALIEANSRWYAYTGQTASSARGNGWMAALHPDDVGRVSRAVADDVRGGTIYEAEYRLRRASDGAYRWHIARALPVRDEAGHVLAWFGGAADIDDLRQAERAVVETAEREQQRIGRDLHDSLAQLLTGVAFQARLLQTRLAKRKVAEARDAAQIARYLQTAVRQAREMAAALQPIEATPDGLSNGLRRFGRMVRDLFRVSCRVVCSPTLTVADTAVATHLYRLAQEATNNAMKHGVASSVSISLRRTARALVLRVKDDGKGFAADSKRGGNGLGLNTMRYRAGAIGGTLDIRSGRGGTTVTCRVPLRAGA